MVKLGQIDMVTEVLLLSFLSAVHMDSALHIMAYLGIHRNSNICMDPTYPDIGNEQVPAMYWKAFYDNAKEPIPPNAINLFGKSFNTHMLVDSNHLGTI